MGDLEHVGYRDSQKIKGSEKSVQSCMKNCLRCR